MRDRHVRWLHLTDLHVGQTGYGIGFPDVETAFFNDLGGVIKQTGPLDFILFTGDLSYSGKKTEYDLLTDFLKRLYEKLRAVWDGCGFDAPPPYLVTVPGNHDLVWPAAIDPAAIVLQEHWSREDVQNEFWSTQSSSYRRLIENAFKEYTTWSRSHQFPSILAGSVTQGLLPGDFAAAVDVTSGLRVGVVGLNSAFLQLGKRKGGHEGQLVVAPPQLRAVLGANNDWLAQNQITLLLTHHPVHWLTREAQSKFEQQIAPAGRFAVHLFGHMHDPEQVGMQRFGQSTKMRAQGISLFGLEHYEAIVGGQSVVQEDRRHGYTIGQIRVTIDKAFYRIWPRAAAGDRHAVRLSLDTSILPGHDPATDEIDISGSCRLTRQSAPPRPPQGPSLKPAHLPPIPKIDELDALRHLFVGREDILNDLEEGVRGLMDGDGERSGAVRFYWIHGLGGMGKTWLLRTVYLNYSNQLSTALIDWSHESVWKDPLSGPPFSVRDMCVAIAYRLAQLHGTGALEPYWLTEKRVTDAAGLAKSLREDFVDAQQCIMADGAMLGPGRNSRRLELRRVLETFGLCTRDTAEFNFRTIFEERRIERQVFEAWAQSVVSDNEHAEAAIRPDDILVSSLRNVLEHLCAKVPLLLILDTCELLSSSLESALRAVITSLLGRSRLFVLVGSQRRPDALAEFGDKDRWDAIPAARRRVISFNENVRLSVDEISNLLGRLTRSLPAELVIAELAARIHRVTLGVPLGVGVLVNLHEGGDDIMRNLAALQETISRYEHEDILDDDDEPGDDDDGISRPEDVVVNALSRRYFAHLSRRGANDPDYRAVMGLAVLRRARPQILNAWWSGNAVARMRELSSRHTIVDGRGVHETVAHFLRAAWRREPPAGLRECATELLAVLDKLPAVGAETTQASFSLALDRIYLYSWLLPLQETLSRCAGLLILGKTFEHGLQDLERLVSHLCDDSSATFRAGFRRASVGALDRVDTEWLKSVDLQTWTPLQGACLKLQSAIVVAEHRDHEWSTKSKKSKQEFAIDQAALSDFQAVFQQMSDWHIEIPQKKLVARTYLMCVFRLTIDNYSNVEIARNAQQWVQRLNLDSADCDAEMGHVFHNLRDYVAAEAAYRRGLAKPNLFSRDRALFHRYVGHLYFRHREGTSWTIEAAAAEFEAALQLVPSDRISRAERINCELKLHAKSATTRRHVDRALELWREQHFPKAGLAASGLELANYLQDLGEATAAVQVREEAMTLANSAELSDHNGIAWYLYLSRDLEQALKFAESAHQAAPDDLNVRQTLAAILARRGGAWDVLMPHLSRLFADGAGDFRQAYADWLLMLEDLRPCATATADLLREYGRDAVWRRIEESFRTGNPFPPTLDPEG